MAKIALWMYSNENGHIISEKLRSMLTSRGHTVVDGFDLRHAYSLNGAVHSESGVNLSECDLLYHMNADEQSAQQHDLLTALGNAGVRVVNTAQAYHLARDKYFTNQVLRQAGVPVPDSILATSRYLRAHAVDLFERWGRLLIKPRNFHGGRGIVMFSEPGQFVDALDLFRGEEGIYIERFIDFGENDYRAEVLYGEVIGGYSRTRQHAFKTNIAAGGRMTPSTMSSEISSLALRAAEAIGMDCTIVDMVRNQKSGQMTVLEVNPIMGIFVEHAMQAGDKSVVRDVHASYAYDDKKLELLASMLHRLAARPLCGLTIKEG